MSEQLDLEDWLRENPKTLTEQWKKGELELGKYYIKTIYGGVVEDTHIRTKVGRVWNNYQDDEIIEVLAPVPSYDHFVELTEKAKENQQLKELLARCGRMLDSISPFSDFSELDRDDLTREINEVLK